MEDFEEVYTSYAPQVFRVCMGYINNMDEAKDLTQETFISVWKNLASFKNQSRISTWIFRIATNNCLRAIERSKRAKTAPLPFQLTDHHDERPDEKLALLYRCIGELEELDRIIISLVLEDLPQAEIAEIVGLSAGNIRVRVHRVKEKLAGKIKRYEQF